MQKIHDIDKDGIPWVLNPNPLRFKWDGKNWVKVKDRKRAVQKRKKK